MLIIAVDPGTTTGYAYLAPEAKLEGPFTGQMEPQEFCEFVHDLAEDFIEEDIIIVCERFTIGERTQKVAKAGSYDALDVIGGLRYISKRYLKRDLEMQTPAEVMSLFPDRWLKERDWYTRGKPHANDATRHLAYYLARHKLIRINE